MAHDKNRIYGEWFTSLPPLAAKHADRILGARVSHDQQGRPEWVDIQWQGSGELYEQVQMDFVNAMFLLSVLKSMQLDSGIPFPDDPRAER